METALFINKINHVFTILSTNCYPKLHAYGPVYLTPYFVNNLYKEYFKKVVTTNIIVLI